ncbi:protein-disulfide reductase DsbD family protein [Vibrio hangzhouensis]|uniref:protein-disulfide reductase DsbD family protein n=1 Tax=Vibrio hangzhouensis TaxID=462991 RepID=UPI001C98C855|nr:protein-disulfide reductase DsbD domain-containing protein [Vibrio hangzhouensis]MBY6196190.1 thioredoxin family protein [Vibrio hangzhouensis]
MNNGSTLHTFRHPSFRTLLIVTAILVVLSSLYTPTATAQSTGWIQDPMHPPVKVRLLSTGQLNSEKRQLEMVVDVRLEGDWKTYWRSPGEGGVAPVFDWSDSTNIDNIDWHWPVPAYYEQLGVLTLGYKHQVSFPLVVSVTDPSQPVSLKANLRLSSCTNICVIADYPIQLDIEPGRLVLDADASYLFAQGMSLTPKENNQVTIEGNYWDQQAQTLLLKLRSTSPWNTPLVLVDGSDVSDEFFSQPALTIEGTTLYALYKVSNWLGKADIANKQIQVTVSDDLILSEATIQVATTPIDVPYQSGLLWMIGFALAGGLILNIMPCVLPVLGMKLNSIIAGVHHSPAQVRMSFLASSAGIITSFMLLAAGLTSLKLAGHLIGWGIQFQNYWFIGFMALVTLVFSANLLGLYNIQLPSSLNTWLAGKGNQSYGGHFIQGMFATLLATPCSAPFLGTAVAYALGASFIELWLIFVALGVGMSLPWLLFTAFPGLVRMFPRPGPWMNTVKLIFGAMMLLTSLWLVSLLSSFIGAGLTVILTIVILLALMVLVGKRYGRNAVIILSALSVVLVGGGLIVGSVTADRWSTPIVDNLDWQKLERSEITDLVAQGNIVFVDVTADWCITCKANKIGVVLQDPVYSALQQPNVIVMRGDWTTPSDDVTQYLHSYGRYGVPFNIVYGPNHPEGIPLPVVLTSDAVIEAIKLAGGDIRD